MGVVIVTVLSITVSLALAVIAIAIASVGTADLDDKFLSLSLEQQIEFNSITRWMWDNRYEKADVDKYLAGEYDETLLYLETQEKLVKEAKDLEGTFRVVTQGSAKSSKQIKSSVSNINTADGMPQFKN